MATPHIAGAWAVLKQASPSASVAQLLTDLQSTAVLLDDLRVGGTETDLPRISLDMALGESIQRTTFAIFNRGPVALNVTSIVPETPAAWISVNPAGPFTVSPWGVQEVVVFIDFDLAPAGTTVTRLLVNSDDPDESPWPGGVNISVTKAAPAGPEFESDPVAGSTLDFGAVQTGAESTAQTVQVGNIGDQNLTLACALSGTNAGDFTIRACSGPVAPAGTTDVTVTCTPSVTGARTASLDLTTNDADEGSVSYTLTCTGQNEPAPTAPEFESDPVAGSTLDLGTVFVGVESSAGTVEVGNIGDANLTLACALSGANAGDFTITACSGPVAPAGTTDVTVTCTPSAAGERTASLDLTTNDTDEGSPSYALSCTGEPLPDEMFQDGFEGSPPN
jgi:hypothetical protein